MPLKQLQGQVVAKSCLLSSFLGFGVVFAFLFCF